MILYRSTIKEFINDTSNPDLLVAKIIAEMKHKLGRSVGESEKRSWRTTLASMSYVFNDVNPKDEQYVLLEYKIPFSQKRIDVIIAGKNTKNTVCIVELKGWSEAVFDGEEELKINTRYKRGEHPAYEAKDYKNILINRFSDINNYFDVHAKAFLPNLIDNKGINNKHFDDINKVITTYTKGNANDFIKYIEKTFYNPIKLKYVDKLSKLEYKPSKAFLEHLKDEFEEIELIKSQRTAYNKIVRAITFNEEHKRKTLINISGTAGSGKTIVAFKVLSYLTKSGKNTKLILPGPEFRDSILKTYKKYTNTEFIGGAYAKGRHDYTIVDEAHKATGQGHASAFYDSLFNHSNFVITLLDDMQVVNKKGITRSQVENIAAKKGFIVQNLNLTEQFRNASDATYTDWLQNWIFNIKNNQDEFVQNYFKFNILNEKDFNKTYSEMYDNHNVRLMSFWTQTWGLNSLDENGMPKATVQIGTSNYIWNPNWGWLDEFKKMNPQVKISPKLNRLCAPKGINFNTTKKGKKYAAYFNTVQGSEFDYMFVHIPKMFFLNNKGKIDVDLSELQMREMKSQIWVKNKKPIKGDIKKELLNKKYFLNRLFVALTRGTKGIFIFVEDHKLNEYLKKAVKPSSLN